MKGWLMFVKIDPYSNYSKKNNYVKCLKGLCKHTGKYKKV